MTAEAIGPAATGPVGFLTGGAGYVEFALSHPGYFELMYRPHLDRGDDPDLVTARSAAFAILDGSAAELAAHWDIDDTASLTVTDWSLCHGLATLLLAGHVDERAGLVRASGQSDARPGLVGRTHLSH